MMRIMLAVAKTCPARRAASSLSVERNELGDTGCVAMNMTRRGAVHAANFNHELNVARGTNARMMVMGRKKSEKK